VYLLFLHFGNQQTYGAPFPAVGNFVKRNVLYVLLVSGIDSNLFKSDLLLWYRSKIGDRGIAGVLKSCIVSFSYFGWQRPVNSKGVIGSFRMDGDGFCSENK